MITNEQKQQVLSWVFLLCGVVVGFSVSKYPGMALAGMAYMFRDIAKEKVCFSELVRGRQILCYGCGLFMMLVGAVILVDALTDADQSFGFEPSPMQLVMFFLPLAVLLLANEVRFFRLNGKSVG